MPVTPPRVPSTTSPIESTGPPTGGTVTGGRTGGDTGGSVIGGRFTGGRVTGGTVIWGGSSAPARLGVEGGGELGLTSPCVCASGDAHDHQDAEREGQGKRQSADQPAAR